MDDALCAVHHIAGTLQFSDHIGAGGELTQVDLSSGVRGELLENLAKVGLKIIKYDRQSHRPMAGVTFEIYRDGLSIGRYVNS